ncbi:MAG: head GIN domain-containing protein [Flavobacteriaceae bacterium]
MRTLKLLLAPVLLLASCNIDDGRNNGFGNNCVDGTGPLVNETRSFSSFHSISNNGVGNILLTQGTQEDVTIEAQANILQILKTEVVDETLVISLVDGQCINSITETVTFTVSIPEIKNLELDGVGDFNTQNDIALDSLNLKLNGVGNFGLTGSSDYLDIDLTGVGNVEAFDLSTSFCDIVISGVGTANVTVSDTLNVVIVGQGTVSYKGNPEINSDITGNGEVVNAN